MYRGALVPMLSAIASALLAAQEPKRGVPTSRLIQVDSGVRLEIVDWGGHGAPLVFLAGDGNTAHVFDEFAPQFTDRFHVIGITRRGFGASAGVPPPRDLDTLVTDITRVLDSLAVGKVTFVGHSIAGEEMTRFAELHKDRSAGLVYLDAAYDRTGIDTLARRQPPTPAPRIRSADTASFASLSALYARVMGVRLPESEVRATNRFDAQGHFKGEVTPMELRARVASGPRKARYDLARCRALAIYAVPDSAPDQVPYYAELGPGGRMNADALLRFVKGYLDASRGEFARFPDHVVVDVHGSNHYVFLQHPDQVTRAMRAFLAGSAR